MLVHTDRLLGVDIRVHSAHPRSIDKNFRMNFKFRALLRLIYIVCFIDKEVFNKKKVL